MLPIDETLATLGVLASDPKKSMDDAINLLEDGLVEGNGREEVSWDCIENVVDKRQPVATGEDGGTPCR